MTVVGSWPSCSQTIKERGCRRVVTSRCWGITETWGDWQDIIRPWWGYSLLFQKRTKGCGMYERLGHVGHLPRGHRSVFAFVIHVGLAWLAGAWWKGSFSFTRGDRNFEWLLEHFPRNTVLSTFADAQKCTWIKIKHQCFSTVACQHRQCLHLTLRLQSKLLLCIKITI